MTPKAHVLSRRISSLADLSLDDGADCVGIQDQPYDLSCAQAGHASREYPPTSSLPTRSSRTRSTSRRVGMVATEGKVRSKALNVNKRLGGAAVDDQEPPA